MLLYNDVILELWMMVVDLHFHFIVVNMLPPVSFYITVLLCQGEGVQLPLEMGSTLPCYKLTPGKNVILLSTPLFKLKCPIPFCCFFV